MKDQKYNFLDRGDELRNLGIEIDELRIKAMTAEAGSRGQLLNEIDELRTKIETARDNLIQIFVLIRNQDEDT
jgi:CHASE3 domain sensor protein